MNANAIVQKLWRLCTVLRKDGITYQQYVTELTYLLFLKMMAERNRETGSLPKGMRWADLVKANGLAKLEHYRNVLVTLGATSTFGDLYEGLLQKNAEETKRGAGQYFTPRVLIELLVRLMQPQPGEVIQDPAAGTGGFLIAADRYMKARTDDYLDLGEKEQEFQKRRAIHGMENVPGTLRLLLMNLYLHDIDGDPMRVA